MSEISDTIPELSTTTPLGIAGVLLTQGYYLGEYGSLSVIAIADQVPVDVAFEFSGNNIDWDYSHPPLNLSVAGVGERQNLVIVAKWVRLRVTNNSGVPLGYLRAFTYGSVENTALDVQVSALVDVNIVSPIPVPVDIVSPSPVPVDLVNPLPLPVQVVNPGGVSPSVAISDPLTLASDLKVSNLVAEIQYMFTKGLLGTVTPKTWEFPYSDLKATETFPSSSIIAPLNGFGLMMLNPPGVGLPADLVWTGRALSFRAGQVVTIRFQCYFVQSLKSIAGNNFATMMGCGAGYLKPGSAVENFIGFGYGNPADPMPGIFAIILNRAGSTTNIPQPTWNIDPADGTVNLPLMNTWDLKNSFEISATETKILFKVLSPIDGLYYPVHQIVSTNNTRLSLLQDFSLSFLAYQTMPSGVDPIGINQDILGISSFLLGLQSDFNAPYDRFSFSEFTNYPQNGVEIYVMGIQHSGTLSGNACYTSVHLDSFTGISTSNQAGFFQIYRNKVVPATTVIPLVDNLGLIPIQGLQFSNVVLPPPPIDPGIVMFRFFSDGSSVTNINLTQYNIWLDTDDIIMATYQTVSAAGAVGALGAGFGYSSGITRQ